MNEGTQRATEMPKGDPTVAQELLPLVYNELRRLAAYRVANAGPGQTMQPTSLVHEAYLRLTAQQEQQWANRAHFFAAAAEAMRRILVEDARRKSAVRHGGGQLRLNIDDVEIAAETKHEEVLAVSEALETFAARNAQRAELVKLRYFVGLTLEETAEVLGIPERTAKRHWAFARAWLLREIRRNEAL